MILEIEGKRVQVDESFAKLSPEQQQAQVNEIAKSLAPKAAEESPDEFVNPLMAAGAGAIAAPMVAPGIRSATQEMVARKAGLPSQAIELLPGEKWQMKTGFGMGPGETVREVGEAYKTAQQEKEALEALKNRPVSKIAKHAMRSFPEEKAARLAELERQLGPELAAQHQALRDKAAQLAKSSAPLGERLGLPRAVQSAGSTIYKGLSGAVPPVLGRMAAGAGAGFQAADAYNRLKEGDISGGAISGLGALGSAASLVPHPLIRGAGLTVGIGAEMLNQYLDRLKRKNEGMATGGKVEKKMSKAERAANHLKSLKMAAGGQIAMKEGGHTTPAWQRAEGKSPSGGLNAVGRASYKRETGGTLKAPQPEGGSRKKSFCARMGGMKKKLTSSKTANDPDSRINKALRKWKC